MPSPSKVVLAVGTLLLVSAPTLAFAQGRGVSLFLFEQEIVQKELNFSDEQKAKAQDVVNKIRQTHIDEAAAIRKAPAEKRLEKAIAANEAMTADVFKALDLKEGQVKRIRQISLQNDGWRAFGHKDVVEKLKLADDQKKEIEQIGAGYLAQSRAIAMNAGPNRDEAMMLINALGRETNAKILTVLKDDQKIAWKEMTGEPFEFVFLPRRPIN
jgi:hypothetical protein